MENEIKLAFDNELELKSVMKAAWFVDMTDDDKPHEAVRLTNIYFDTKDRRLQKTRTSVRVRLYEDSNGRHYEHTVKYGGQAVNGLHQRYEWNVDSDSDSFDVDSFRKSITDKDDPVEMLDAALDGITGGELLPLCSTYCERTTYIVNLGNSSMEVCFDTGTIKGGDLTDDICELEIELIKGDVDDIMKLSDIIIKNTNAHLFDDSKYIRAVRLLDKSNGNG